MIEDNIKQFTEAKNTDLMNVSSRGGAESAHTLTEGRDVKLYAQAVGRPIENRRQGSPCSSDNGKRQDQKCNLILCGVDESNKGTLWSQRSVNDVHNVTSIPTEMMD